MIPLGDGVLLVTRSEWGGRPPLSVSALRASYGTTAHWEGPHMGAFPHASCATKVRVIQRYHMDTKGWQDIAYTAVVCPHGYVFQGRWIGRRTAANGTNQGNGSAYAVCYLGGIADAFTPEGRRAMRVVMDFLDRNGGAGPGRNGHRDWKPTQCPGDIIYDWVHAGMPVPAPPPRPEDWFNMATEQQLETVMTRVVTRELEKRDDVGPQRVVVHTDQRPYRPGDPVYLTDFLTAIRRVPRVDSGLDKFIQDTRRLGDESPLAKRVGPQVIIDLYEMVHGTAPEGFPLAP